MSVSRFALASALVAAISTPAFAAEAEAAAEADILVVGQKDAPITVVPRGLAVSLDKDNFEAINAVNVEDLMKYTPNFFVRKRFAGDDNAVVAMRGANTVQSARTIVMVDGFVVSNFLGNRYDFPPKWNVVGPSEVKQFDIVYGPYSARYGGNSMGGVVSVTTQTPKEGFSANGTVQTMIMPFKEYGFNETFTGYSVEGGIGYKQKDGPWSVRASFRHFDNTGQSMSYNLLQKRSGSTSVKTITGGYVDNSLVRPTGLNPAYDLVVFGAASPVDVTQDQARLRVGYEADNGWKVEALGVLWKTKQYLLDPRIWITDSNTDAPFTSVGRVTLNGTDYNTNAVTMSQTWRTEYLTGVKLAGPIAGWDLSLNLSRYWIASQDARTSTNYDTGVASTGGTLSLVNEPGWYTGDLAVERQVGAHKIAFGANANLYETSTDTWNTSNWKAAANPIYSNSRYGKTSQWGLWVEDAYDLGDEFILTAGMRYDRWHAFKGGIGGLIGGNRIDTSFASRSDDSISPKLSLQGGLPADIDFQISLGLATRFPTVGELFQGSLDASGNIIASSFNPLLKPEKSTDASLLLRRTFGKVQVTTSFFLQDVKDAVYSLTGYLADGSSFSGYQNLSKVRQYGVELILEGKDVLIPGLDFNGSVSWMSAKIKRVYDVKDNYLLGVQMPRIPEWRSNGNLRYRVTEPVKLSVGWRFASRPNSGLPGSAAESPSRGGSYGYQTEYFTVDSRLSYDINKHLQLSAGVDNLFNDRAYVSHPLPQRTYVLDLKAKW